MIKTADRMIVGVRIAFYSNSWYRVEIGHTDSKVHKDSLRHMRSMLRVSD